MIKSDCENIQHIIPLYIDNMLSEEETSILCEHIKSCSICKEELTFMQHMVEKTAELPEVPVSKSFHQGLMEKVSKEPKIFQKWYAFSWKTATSFAAAAAVVALSVVSFLSLERDGNSQNPDVYITSPAPAKQTEPGNGEEISAQAPQQQTEKSDAEKQNRYLEENGKHKKVATSKTKQPITETAGQASVAPASFDRALDSAPAAEASHAPTVARIADGERVSDEETAAWSHTQDQTEENGKTMQEELETLPKSSDGASGESAASMFSIATVTVSKTELDAAHNILSVYPKDATGYRVEGKLQTVLSQLSALDGYHVSYVASSDISAEYIVLE